MSRTCFFKMTKAIIELELVYPYQLSMGVLVEFCYLWDCHIISGGTQKLKATISMPSIYFKQIFGRSPITREYAVPKGMEKFISKMTVKEVLKKR